MSRPEVLNLIDKAEWIELPLPEDSQFDYYSKDDAGNPKPEFKIYYAKVGNLVCIRGIITPKEAIPGSATTIPIVKLPDEIIPDGTINQLCQGTGKNIWLIGIDASNNLTFSRYGTNEVATCKPGNWLSFKFMYIL